MACKDIVFVLGHGRSGTSAITRVLSLCGASLPQSVLAATSFNPRGLWEPIAAWKLDLDFMASVGITEDRADIDEFEIEGREKERYISRIQDFLSTCPVAQTLVFKFYPDPLRFWIEAAQRSDFGVKTVIVFRHPAETFASFRALSPSKETSIEAFNAFWLRTYLLSDRYTRDIPRVFMEYPSILRDWRIEIARLSEELKLDLSLNEDAVEHFLCPELYHQRAAGPITESFAYSWTTRMHAILSSAARGEPVDLTSLDEIYFGYRLNARTFKIAMEKAKDSSLQKLRDYIDHHPVWHAGKDY